MREGRAPHLAFLFSGSVSYPPAQNELKDFYISRELIRRGFRVSWIQLERGTGTTSHEGIDFVPLGSSSAKPFREIHGVLRVLLYCKARGVRCLYLDEWLFLRSRPLQRLMFQFVMKVFGMKLILDQRDPYLDFEVAMGRLSPSTRRYELARIEYALIYRLSTLVIFSSGIYADEMRHEGIPPEKSFGSIRGIDATLFNISVNGSEIRRKLDLNGKFVIGWFGNLHPFRQIDEVLIPLASTIGKTMPGSQIIVGGKGKLRRSIESFVNSRPDAPLIFVGLVPHYEVPKYIAACDVLLCPINTSFRHTRYSAWLKILESLAVGRPIVATWTFLSQGDYKDLKGVIWTGSDLESFSKAILQVKEHYGEHLALAKSQAESFEDYTLESTIARIVDRVVLAAFGANHQV